MFGFSFDKLLVIAIVGVIIVGPARLPRYAARLAEFVKKARQFVDATKDQLSAELGPEFDSIDWKRLDPRQYDPRRIIRDALLDADESETEAVLPRVSLPPRVDVAPDSPAVADRDAQPRG